MAHNTLHSSVSPSLRIIKQTALSEEKATKRGKTSTVFVVVKNSPFQLTVALDNARTNFNHLTFDIALIYDMPGVNKEVAFVSTKPVDYKPSLNDIGDEICFDVKIKVLSSHHEDNFFRLKVVVWDPNSDDFIPLEILSYPIKVISKPMNQRKTKKRAAPTTRRTSKSVVNVPSVSSPPQTAILPSNSAALESSLEKLDVQQQETIRLLHQILAKDDVMEPPAKRIKLDPSPSVEFFKMTPPQEPAAPPEFESAFSTMLQCYVGMTAEEKAERIRKLLRSLTSRDHEQLEEMFDVMSTAGIKTMSPTETPTYNFSSSGGGYHVGHSDACHESCPHRIELVKIDQFYSDVFF